MTQKVWICPIYRFWIECENRTAGFLNFEATHWKILKFIFSESYDTWTYVLQTYSTNFVGLVPVLNEAGTTFDNSFFDN